MNWIRSRSHKSGSNRRRRFIPRVDELGSRLTPAVTASFAASTGILTVTGDALNNTIAVSRNAAGGLLVNGGAVAIKGGTATVANTSLIQVFGLGGIDVLSLEGQGARVAPGARAA